MDSDFYLLFALEEKRYALHVSQVERILPAAQVTPVEGAPSFIAGLLNLSGSILPVLDMRLFLGFPEKEMDPDQRFIYTVSLERPLLLLVDGVEGVENLPTQSIHLPSAAEEEGDEKGLVISTILDQIVLIKNVDDFIDEVLAYVKKEGSIQGYGEEEK